MALHKVEVKWSEVYESHVYIEAEDKVSAMKIVADDIVDYIDKARDNTSDGYMGLGSARVSRYAGEEDDESYQPDNIIEE